MSSSNFGIPPQPPPHSPEVPPSAPDEFFKQRRMDTYARVGAIFAVTPFLGYGACYVDIGVGFPLWCIGVVLAFIGIYLGFRSWRTARPSILPPFAVIMGLLSPVITFFLGVLSFNYSRGRALRRGGKARLPALGAGSSWTRDDAPHLELPPAAVEGWLANARTEIASVAAFNHLANQLLALGAPSTLVRGALEASLEEIAHAEACFGIAQRGRAMSVLRFPEAEKSPDKRASLAALAEECVVEACFLERASAIVAARLAHEEALHPSIRAVLEQIAEEEARHAEHGWDVLAFAVEASPTVWSAAESALARAARAEYPPPVNDASLERFGLASPETWRSALEEAWNEVDARLEAMGKDRPRLAA